MQKVRQRFAYVKNLPYLCTRISEDYEKDAIHTTENGHRCHAGASNDGIPVIS